MFRVLPFLLCALVLTACNTFNNETSPRHSGQYLSRHYSYAGPNSGETIKQNEIANQFPNQFRAQTPQEQMLSTYIWDVRLQEGLNRAIRRTPTDSVSAWQAGHVHYRFKPSTDVYFSSKTDSLCREGRFYWSFAYFERSWDNIGVLMCQIGPNGEWLPVV